jgi:hypothetical protein
MTLRTISRALAPFTAVAALTGVALVALVAPAGAQQLPPDWQMRLDRADAAPDNVTFHGMEQGWHVTTGRAGSGIFWQRGITAEGDYTARARFHLNAPAPHPEAFGVFIGGQDLEAVGQEYLYFIVRQNGEYMIRLRRGDGTENVVGWTAHEAVPVAGVDGPTPYELAVDVGGDQVAFMVNDERVHTLPADQVQTGGAVGLRINHMLDLHVESFEVVVP